MHISERRRAASGQHNTRALPESRPLTAEWLVLLSLTLKLVGFCAVCALVLSLGLSAGEIDAPWQQHALYLSGLAGVLYCGAIGLALWLMRELGGVSAQSGSSCCSRTRIA